MGAHALLHFGRQALQVADDRCVGLPRDGADVDQDPCFARHDIQLSRAAGGAWTTVGVKLGQPRFVATEGLRCRFSRW